MDIPEPRVMIWLVAIFIGALILLNNIYPDS